ncbi:MAG: Ni/Fe hydrogenase subunit alpha, partial [Anaerolineaceae bacterium]|nr:Ni/Fe hydrogenase subunit alpha [Anaerolineaceae bacterium]
MQRIQIDPITRLEGHGKIEIFLDESGKVERTYFQIPELRGFERFALGRPVEEMAVITSRICGVCPEAHHMAAAKAADAVYHVELPRPAKLLRELLYSAFFCADHTTHFYVLSGPDFVMGPDAPVAERNILGVIHKVGLEIGGKVITMRKYGHAVIEMLGGRKVHPCTAVPGGVSHGINEDQRQEIEKMGRWAIDFARFSLDLFNTLVLGNELYRDLVLGDVYYHRTYSIGLVDELNRVNFYDGRVSVVDPEGTRLGKYAPADYADWIAEHVEPWTYLKFPYLKKVGWKGFVDGKDSGVYMATPLSRLNAADGMATPLAQAEYEKFYAAIGVKPVHHRLAIHWARLIELLYAAERWVELATDTEITSENFRTLPTAIPTEGVGIVEAPRGTLTHHYTTDERGIVTQ